MPDSRSLLPVLGIVAGILLVTGVSLGLVFGLLRRMAARSAAELRRRFPDARRVDVGAFLFGQQSLGVTQLRGNGTLVLTSSELFFKPWVGKREFLIPLGAIRSIETPKSHLGKTQLVPLLKVVYSDNASRADSIAWRVRDLAGWIRAIEETRA